MTQNNDGHGQGFVAPYMLKERELAARWGVSSRTLQRWRSEGYGPRHHLIGGAVRYRLDAVLAFEDERECGGDQ